MGYPTFYPQARVNIAMLPVESAPIQSSGLIRLGSVAPRDLRFEANPTLVADTFEVTLDENLFPLDPRDVRSVVVDLHLGDAGGLDAQIDTRTDRNRLILGQTDKIVKEIPAEDASTVMLKGRDYSGGLLDEPWQGRSLELGRPFSELVEEVIGSIPSHERMQVELADPSFDPVVPKGKGRKRSEYRAQPDKKVWDALVELGLKVGAVITVQRDKIVIQPPRSVITDSIESKTPLFVEGQNLKDLSIERLLGKPDVPNILVQSIDPASGEIVEARWPEDWKETARAMKVRERAKKTQNVEFRRFVVRHPDPTEPALRDVAKQVYQFHAQEQVKISFKTNDMAVSSNPVPKEIQERLEFGAASDVAPTTQLRNGSPVRIRVEPEARNILEKAITRTEKERRLRQMGFAESVAGLLSRGHRLFDELLFVNRAVHSYTSSGEGGYRLEVDAINFIEVAL